MLISLFQNHFKISNFLIWSRLALHHFQKKLSVNTFVANQIIFSQSSPYQCNLHSDVPVLLGSFFVEPTVGPVYGSRIRPQYAFNEEAIIH